MKMYHLY